MVSTSAIKAIASIGIRLALSTELCVRRLLQLLDFDRGHVVSETLVALSSKYFLALIVAEPPSK